MNLAGANIGSGGHMRQWHTLDESRDQFKRRYSEIPEPIAKTRPKDIKKIKGKWGNNPKMKEVAMSLVKFFQSRNCWCSFTLSEFYRYLRRKKQNPDIMFYGILGPFYDEYNPVLIGSYSIQPEPWLVAHSDGRYMITDAFIKRCLGK